MLSVVRDNGYLYCVIMTDDELEAERRRIGEYAPTAVVEHVTEEEAEAVLERENARARAAYGAR